MKRKIFEQLKAWKDSPLRMPLLLRGARQTGKSYLIEHFGEMHFESLVIINFELMPGASECFLSLEPDSIISKLEFITGKNINPGKTLLFLDEIQECPQALQALRYFKEKKPALHVIAAGSLLEFVLNSENFRMPVGRIEMLYLRPMSFLEFLLALDENKLVEFIQTVQINENIIQPIHEKLSELAHLYFHLGGMPAVVQAYQQLKKLSPCQHLQKQLLNTYRNDFGKYADLTNQHYLKRLFGKAPGLIAKQFKYADVDPTIESRYLKNALQLLKQAGLLHQVFMTQASGLPLISQINEKKFKLLFLDIGLANCAQEIDIQARFNLESPLLNKGALIEQFVGQELLAYQSPENEAALYFWQRDGKEASAEIDYLISLNGKIIPIEVKSGKTGRLKSLHTFINEKKLSKGIVISEHEFQQKDNITFIPFYLTSQIERLV